MMLLCTDLVCIKTFLIGSDSWLTSYFISGWAECCRSFSERVLELLSKHRKSFWISFARASLENNRASKWPIWTNQRAYVWTSSCRGTGKAAQVRTNFENNLLFASPALQAWDCHFSLVRWFAWLVLYSTILRYSIETCMLSWGILADCSKSLKFLQDSRSLWTLVSATQYAH